MEQTEPLFRCPHYCAPVNLSEGHNGSSLSALVRAMRSCSALACSPLSGVRARGATAQADRIACLSKQLPPQVLLRSSIEVFSAVVSTRHWTGHKPNSTDAAQDETNDTQSRASTAQERGRLRSLHSSSRVHGCGLALAVRRPQRASTGTVSTGRDADGRAGARGA